MESTERMVPEQPAPVPKSEHGPEDGAKLQMLAGIEMQIRDLEDGGWGPKTWTPEERGRHAKLSREAAALKAELGSLVTESKLQEIEDRMKDLDFWRAQGRTWTIEDRDLYDRLAAEAERLRKELVQ